VHKNQQNASSSKFLSDSQCHVFEHFCTCSVSGVVQVPWRIHGLLFAWEQSLLSVQLTTVSVHSIAFCTVCQIFHSKFFSSLGAWTLNSCYQQIGLSSRIPSPSLIPRHETFFQCSFHTWHLNQKSIKTELGKVAIFQPSLDLNPKPGSSS
jgi:hypothetical protein